jgi:two-component system, response regulator
MNAHEIEVILIEDNPDDAILVIRELKKNNFANKLIHLKDGAEALDFIFGTGAYEGKGLQSGAPKVILLDLKMPKVNGIEVLEKVKTDPRTKLIPVVILTSSAEDPDIKICYELGANSYIVKPVEFENFSKCVTELGMYWLLLNHSKR